MAYADGRRMDRPPDEVVNRAVAEYLNGIRFQNGVVRWGYLASLGLKSAP